MYLQGLHGNSAILTILQIDSVAADPLSRYSALLSLVCALMSLLYGCMYSVKFGTMRKVYKAFEWAQASILNVTGFASRSNSCRKRKTKTRVFCGMYGSSSQCPRHGYHGNSFLRNAFLALDIQT